LTNIVNLSNDVAAFRATSVKSCTDARDRNGCRYLASDCFGDRTDAHWIILGKGGVDSVFLMFVGVAVLGLVAATRTVETRNPRLEQMAR
jgi:hypothetical protein